jgi:hypothetical protein
MLRPVAVATYSLPPEIANPPVSPFVPMETSATLVTLMLCVFLASTIAKCPVAVAGPLELVGAGGVMVITKNPLPSGSTTSPISKLVWKFVVTLLTAAGARELEISSNVRVKETSGIEIGNARVSPALGIAQN